MVMGGLYYKVHGMRLAQASEMQLDLKVGGAPSKGGAPMTHMQLDGEPWQQELPFEDGAPPMHVSEVLGIATRAEPFSMHCFHVIQDYMTVLMSSILAQHACQTPT